jgi:predicted dehydrogenase
LATVTFAGGAVASVITSLLSPRELSRIRIDTTGGTLEVDHLYGYCDADWSWSAAPDAAQAAVLGRDPGLSGSNRSGTAGATAGSDPWIATAGADLPSNHKAQIDRLVDDLLAGRPHDTTLSSTRPTMELVTALYASSIRAETVRRGQLTPDDGFYHRLDGGLPADTITARMSATTQ